MTNFMGRDGLQIDGIIGLAVSWNPRNIGSECNTGIKEDVRIQDLASEVNPPAIFINLSHVLRICCRGDSYTQSLSIFAEIASTGETNEVSAIKTGSADRGLQSLLIR